MVAGTIEIDGKKFVVLPQTEYEQLMSRRASGEDQDLPPLPMPLPNGNFDAIEFARASLARKLILDRRASGLTQAELARISGVRVETLNRIERCKITPSIATVDKLDRAMKRGRENAFHVRAARGSREKIKKVLAKIPARKPLKGDELLGRIAARELKSFRNSGSKGTPWTQVKKELHP